MATLGAVRWEEVVLLLLLLVVLVVGVVEREGGGIADEEEEVEEEEEGQEEEVEVEVEEEEEGGGWICPTVPAVTVGPGLGLFCCQEQERRVWTALLFSVIPKLLSLAMARTAASNS
jgi:hypothetical protein